MEVNQNNSTEFQRHGFLSITAAAEAERFRTHLTGWTGLYYDVNAFAQNVVYQVQPDNRNARQLLAFSCFYRASTAFQSVFLLVERGIDVESKVLLRSMTETAIVLTAIAKQPKFAEEYIRASEDTERKLLKKTLEVQTDNIFFTTEESKVMRARLDVLEQRKKSDPNWTKEITVLDIAEKAELGSVYKQHYAYLSMYTHPSPSGMAEYLVTDAAGSITHHRVGRHDDDAEGNLRVAVVMMLQAASAIGQIFNLSHSDRLSEFDSRMKDVIDNSPSLKWAHVST